MQIECAWCSYCSWFCSFENWCFWDTFGFIILQVATIMEVHLSRFVLITILALSQVLLWFHYFCGCPCLSLDSLMTQMFELMVFYHYFALFPSEILSAWNKHLKLAVIGKLPSAYCSTYHTALLDHPLKIQNWHVIHCSSQWLMWPCLIALHGLMTWFLRSLPTTWLALNRVAKIQSWTDGSDWTARTELTVWLRFWFSFGLRLSVPVHSSGLWGIFENRVWTCSNRTECTYFIQNFWLFRRFNLCS